MGLFDPKVDARITPVAATATPKPSEQARVTGLQTGLGLLGQAFDFGTSLNKAASKSGSGGISAKDQAKDAKLLGLSDSLLKVEALRRDGRIAEADRAEQTVLANAARDGLDLSSGQTKALFRATTGRDPAHMGMSREQVVSEDLMKTPEYQNTFLASYASGTDMTPMERNNFALAQMARQQGHNLMIQNEKIAWHEGRSEAFSGVVNAFQTTNLGVLSLAAQNGEVIPLGAIDQTQAQWEAQKAQLLAARPTGLEDKDWKPLQAQIDGVDATFAFLRSISTGEAIDGRIAQAASAAISQMDISDVKKQMLTKTIKDPQAFLQFNVIEPSEFKAMMEASAVASFDKGEFGLLSDPNVDTGTNSDGSPKLFPDSIMQDISGKDPAELLKQAGNIVKGINIGGTSSIMNDADNRDGVVSTLSKAFAAMTTISKDNKEFVSGTKVNEVFDGTVIAAIDEVAKVAPSQARTLLRQGEEALNQQDAVASAALQNLISQSAGFGYENGKVVMNAEAMENLGWDQGIQDKFTAAADQYYGGDLAALFSDQGRKIDPYNLDTKQARDLARGGMVAGLLGGIEDLNRMASTVTTIRNKRNEFRTRADALTPQAEEASEDTAAIIAGQTMGTIEATDIRGFNKVAEDTPFLNEVAKVGNRLGVSPTDLLAVISFETVGTFSPSVRNPNGSATGLIQFIESTAKGLGTSTKELSEMSRVEQMAYVEQYLKPFKGRMKNLGDLYMAIHWPAGVGKGDDYVMYKRGSKEYEANKNLDLNNDGAVTRGDTLQRVRSVFGKGGFKDGPSRGPENGALGGTTPQVDVSTLADASSGADPVGIYQAPSTTSAGGGSGAAEVAPVSGSGAPTAVRDAAVEGREAPAQPSAPAEDKASKSVAKQMDAAAIAKLVDNVLTPKQKRQIRAAGYRPEETEFFKDQAEAEAALAAGEVDRGTLYVTEDGNVFLLE